jgi:hypothetical protein
MARTIRALIINRTIPFEAKRIERGNDRLIGTGLLAWRINVFDPEKPAATGRLRLEITGTRRQQ